MQVYNSFSFEFNPKDYPADFPKKLDFNKEDPSSFQPFEEAYYQAQQARLPYYAVAVVESEGNVALKNEEPKIKTFFHIHDMTHLTTFVSNQKKQDLTPTDPVSCQPIKKIYYFAMKCFEADKDILFNPKDPTKKMTNLLPFDPHQDEVINQMMRDALNCNINTEGKQQQRRTQQVLANLIQQGNLFPTLDTRERMDEHILWLWCAATDSHSALLNLFKTCVADPKLISSTPFLGILLVEISQISNPKLSRQERQAILEAKTLVKQFGLKSPLKKAQ